MEENDDSFIIDSKKLMEEFEKFLKSLSGAYDIVTKDKDPFMKEIEIEGLIETNFPEYEKDILPFVDALKWARKFDMRGESFMSIKDELSIYRVLSIFLINIYQVSSSSFLLLCYKITSCVIHKGVNTIQVYKGISVKG